MLILTCKMMIEYAFKMTQDDSEDSSAMLP